jgi:hypothetical protein
MSILSDLLGQFGGLTGIAKQGQSGALAQIGNMYNSPIGATQSGMPMGELNPAFQSGALAQIAQPTEQPDWLDRNSEALGKFGDMATRFGSGMSAASAPSRMPVDFGQALAGGQQAVDAGKQQDLANQLTQAQTGAAIAKGSKFDLENQAQTALVKSNMGQPLTPQEQAALQSYDQMQQSKLTYTQDPSGQFIPRPAARSIMPQGQAPSGQPDLQDAGFMQFLKAKGLM